MEKINRRTFIKNIGAGTAVVGAAALAGCEGKNNPLVDSTSALGEIPTDQMAYRTNPKTGEKVSILGYGCMRWPMKPKEDGEGEELDQEQINRLVDCALEHGVNYFDTAPVYCQGQSEKATGIALARHPRDSYFIATKLSNFSPDTQTYEGSVGMYKNSLKELQTDYIDYLLLHALGGNIGDFYHRFVDNGVMEFLMKEREAGRIRNLGFSFHGGKDGFDKLMELHETYHWDFVQIQMNYLDWSKSFDWQNAEFTAEYLYKELEKRNIPVVIMEPLLGGRLAKVNEHVAGQLKQAEPERSIASWAFRFCGTWPGVLTVLSGMTYMEHLEDNLRSFCPLKPLTEDEVAMLGRMAQEILKYPNIPCTACQYCMPCPYGLDIPGIFAHYNKCVNEGNMLVSSADENYRKARRAFLVGYDRSVPRLRQADHCIRCGRCLEHCPQHINIPEQMDKINQYAETLKQELEF